MTSGLQRLVERVGDALSAAHGRAATLRIEEVGTLDFVGRGVATASGLAGVRSEELILFPGDLLGLAFDLDE
ncbi:MAG TPA: hypothetical protein VLT81_12850, partial [Chondromyces sp.]|nr:hypothetical protein [Chondromyces sp.]